MSIYDNVNFLPFLISNLPPNKRQATDNSTQNIPKLNEAIIQPLQWNADNYFKTYTKGSVDAPWSSATTYAKGANAVGDNNVVYQSLVAGNLNNNPILSSSAGKWIQISPDFVGTLERIAFNNSIACFNYILNRYFRSNFVQPPAMNTSDIYITMNAPTVLVLGRANQTGLCVGGRGNFNGMIAGRANFNHATGFADYTINAPNAFQIADSNFSNKLTNLAQKYTVAGYSFNINLY